MSEIDKQLYLEIFEQVPNVRGFFSTKYGASEASPYDRDDVFEKAGLQDAMPVWPQQVHKDRIAVVAEKGGEPLRIPDTDGLITDVPGVLLTTVHADCLPVYFYDPQKRAIGLVHAGWRGTALGIAQAAVRKMQEEYGCRPQDIIAHIGPGISSCCFEVGPEVPQEFEKKWSFTGAFTQKRGDKWLMDIKGINQRQLEDAGLLREHITKSSHCTYCEPELFCSYRREGGTYRRMGAGLALTAAHTNQK